MQKKVYCIPYAGGSSLFYTQLANYLAADVKLVPLELSGRGVRMDEDLYTDFNEALIDLRANFLADHRKGEPFVILGYSMGALLAYELTLELEKNNISPLNLICAASDPPNTPRELKAIYSLDDNKLIDYYVNAGGIEDLNEDEKELLKCFLPIIRGDLQVLETYIPSEEKLQTHLLVYSGKSDELKELSNWKNYANKVESTAFEGDHYFLKHNYMNVAHQINRLFN